MLVETPSWNRKEMVREVVRMCVDKREGHVPSALSILDLVWVYYSRVRSERSRFVLSKGHGCLALYVVLRKLGLMEVDFMTWPALGHPERCVEQGIVASTGSLGHGLPMGVGMALARPDLRVYVLMGDRECDEGTTWESRRAVEKLGVRNLWCLVDCNSGDQGRGRVDGHDHGRIEEALKRDWRQGWWIEFNTVKGFGVLEMQAEPEKWHHRVPTEEEYEKGFTWCG